jgi:hypothetical protein
MDGIGERTGEQISAVYAECPVARIVGGALLTAAAASPIVRSTKAAQDLLAHSQSKVRTTLSGSMGVSGRVDRLAYWFTSAWFASRMRLRFSSTVTAVGPSPMRCEKIRSSSATVSFTVRGSTTMAVILVSASCLIVGSTACKYPQGTSPR